MEIDRRGTVLPPHLLVWSGPQQLSSRGGVCGTEAIHRASKYLCEEEPCGGAIEGALVEEQEAPLCLFSETAFF